MAKTRYAIVKVNNHCPSRFVDNVRNEYVCKIKQARDGYHLNCVGCRYGDTKEQLEKKIAQVMLRQELEWYKKHLKIIPKGEIDEPFVRILYENCLGKAKEIVEFLGVVE